MFWPVLDFKPTHRVVVENAEHEYQEGTLVKVMYASGLTPYAWYIDEEGIAQIMCQSELEVV